MGRVKNYDVDGVSFQTLTKGDLIGYGSNPYFSIPPYQRQYTWGTPQVLRLLGDVYDYFLEACEETANRKIDREEDEESAFSEKFIGTFILVEKSPEIKRAKTVLEVVDGQQRLTTLCLSIAAGIRVLLEISEKIAALREEETIDPKVASFVRKVCKEFAEQIRKKITMLYDSSNANNYAPNLFREECDIPEQKSKNSRLRNNSSRRGIPKSCEIAEMTDDEVKACYKSPTARFFFYFAKVGDILSTRNLSRQEFSEAISSLQTGEKYLVYEEEGEENLCYKRNYKLSYDFLFQLSKGMEYDGDFEKLPFNKDLSVENQYEPKPMRKQVEDCVLPTSDLRELVETLIDEFPQEESLASKELWRLMTAALYVFSYLDFLSNRVSIAVITGNKETALDLFETMNTAGQPLGCVETFIPEVYQAVYRLEDSLSAEKNSLLMQELSFGIHKGKSLKNVILDIQKNFGVDKNRSGVPQVVIWFSLICFGKKVGKNFSIQRSELTKNFRAFIGFDHGHFTFDSDTTLRKIYEFMSLFSFVGKWWVYCYGAAKNLEKNRNVSVEKRFEGKWAFENGYLPEELEDQVVRSDLNIFNLCLLFLIRAGQSLSIAIIGRFYIQLLKNPSVANFKELVRAAKAVAAFTTVWLSGEIGSTQYAETQRRTMIHKSADNKSKQIPGELAYFCSASGSSGNNVTAEQLKKSFISGYEVKNGSFSLKTWIKKLPISQLASMRKEVNRFLLLLYWHCSDFQDCYESIGIRDQADKSMNFLTGEKWNVLSELEIEHIVPQEPKSEDWTLDFDPNSFDGKQIINEIGNTTLLPKKLNVYASNNSWEYKRHLYDIVCVTKEEERKKRVDELSEIPAKERTTIKNQLNELYDGFEEVDTFLVSSVRHVEHWSKYVIQTRTKAIAHIVWPLLSEWLGRPEKFDKNAFEALLGGEVAPAATSASTPTAVSISAPEVKRGRKTKAVAEVTAPSNAVASAPDVVPTPAPKAKRGRKPKTVAEVTAPSNAVASAPDAVPTPAPKAKRGRKPKAVAEVTAQSNVASDDVHESLRPFFEVVPRAVWTKIESTRLTIDNATSYLSVRIEEGKTIVEMGRRGQGKRLRSEKTLPASVSLEKISGADQMCEGDVFVYTGTGPEAEETLVGLVKKRRNRFVENQP